MTDEARSYVPTEDFVLIQRVIFKDYSKHIGSTACVVYCYYCCMINKKEGYAFPALVQTAFALGISRSTVQRSNKILLKYGLIAQSSGIGHKHNQYIIQKASRARLNQVLG